MLLLLLFEKSRWYKSFKNKLIQFPASFLYHSSSSSFSLHFISPQLTCHVRPVTIVPHPTPYVISRIEKRHEDDLAFVPCERWKKRFASGPTFFCRYVCARMSMKQHLKLKSVGLTRPQHCFPLPGSPPLLQIFFPFLSNDLIVKNRIQIGQWVCRPLLAAEAGTANDGAQHLLLFFWQMDFEFVTGDLPRWRRSVVRQPVLTSSLILPVRKYTSSSAKNKNNKQIKNQQTNKQRNIMKKFVQWKQLSDERNQVKRRAASLMNGEMAAPIHTNKHKHGQSTGKQKFNGRLIICFFFFSS